LKIGRLQPLPEANCAKVVRLVDWAVDWGAISGAIDHPEIYINLLI